jgi:hypothetical protein
MQKTIFLMRKKIIFVSIVVLAIAAVAMMLPSNKTLVKTIAVEEGYDEAVFDMKGKYQVSEWDSKTIRITTTIDAPHIDDATLKALITAGRYQVEVGKDATNGALIFTMPKKEKTITINHTDLEDFLQFEISIPKGMKYEIKGADAPIEDQMIM